MKIAVINETSAADRNADILRALSGRPHEVVNAGMTRSGAEPGLTYVQTGFLAALLLHLGRADMVVGGCGTGQGFLNAAMQYPGVVCGHILTPLDAWLFAQINGGNCISLMLNQGYGWASEVNLRMIFDQLLGVESGCGYPAARATSQASSRSLLQRISATTHRPMADIVEGLPEEITRPALAYPGIAELLDLPTLVDQGLAEVLGRAMGPLP